LKSNEMMDSGQPELWLFQCPNGAIITTLKEAIRSGL